MGLISASPNGENEFAVDLDGGLYQKKNRQIKRIIITIDCRKRMLLLQI